jgi:large subunit ribosomal protein L17
MRHRVAKKRINRDQDHMRSLMSNLSTELIMHEKIETTLAKARMLRPHIEHMITFAGKAVRSGDKLKKYNAVKALNAKVHLTSATRKLIEDIATRFANTPGGYTRIVQVGNRAGDNASMARIEFTKDAEKKTEKAKATKKAKKEAVKEATKE